MSQPMIATLRGKNFNEVAQNVYTERNICDLLKSATFTT